MTDAARFGSSYLSKFGWDSNKGLGVGGDGRTSHIKVAQKLDMMGIGAAHQKDPNGIAWKQNKDYENLLKRLNEANGPGEEEQAGIVVDGFVKSTGNVDEKKGEPSGLDKETKQEKREKKDRKARKKEKEDTSEEKGKKKKRRRDEDVEENDKRAKKMKRGDKPDPSNLPSKPESEPTSSDLTPSIEQKTSRVVPRHRSYVLLVCSPFRLWIDVEFLQTSGTPHCCQIYGLKIRARDCRNSWNCSSTLTFRYSIRDPNANATRRQINFHLRWQ